MTRNDVLRALGILLLLPGAAADSRAEGTTAAAGEAAAAAPAATGLAEADPFLARFAGRWVGEGVFDGPPVPVEFHFEWAMRGEFLQGSLRIFEDEDRSRVAYEGREFKRPSGAPGEYRIAYFGSAGEQEIIEGRASGDELHCRSTYADGRREEGAYRFEGPDRLRYTSRIEDCDGYPLGSIRITLERADASPRASSR